MPKKRTRSSASPIIREENDPMSKDLIKYADQYVTTAQAAEMMGVGRKHIALLLERGKIKGAKLGYSWLVFLPSLEKYSETKSRRGRPPSGSPRLPETNDGQG